MRKITQWMLVGLVALSMAACSGSPEAQLMGNTYSFASFSEGEGLAEVRAGLEAELAALPAPAQDTTAEASADPFAASAGLSDEALAAANTRQNLQRQLDMVADFYNLLVTGDATITFQDAKQAELNWAGQTNLLALAYPTLSENGAKKFEIIDVTAEGVTLAVFGEGSDKPMGQYKLTKVQ